jgi:hypothetical protein
MQWCRRPAWRSFRLPIKAKETRIMTIRNRIIAAIMSVAIALPLMAATASTALPDVQAQPHARAERVTERHHEHARTERAARRGEAHRAERHEHEHKERDHD